MSDLIDLVVLVPGGGVWDSLGRPPAHGCPKDLCTIIPDWVRRRLRVAASLHATASEAGEKCKIVCCSAYSAHLPVPVDDAGHACYESRCSAAYLTTVECIDAHDILVERTSLDTIGNFFYARALHWDTLRTHSGSRLVVVTSEHHAPRCAAIASWVFQAPGDPSLPTDPYVRCGGCPAGKTGGSTTLEAEGARCAACAATVAVRASACGSLTLLPSPDPRHGDAAADICCEADVSVLGRGGCGGVDSPLAFGPLDARCVAGVDSPIVPGVDSPIIASRSAPPVVAAVVSVASKRRIATGAAGITNRDGGGGGGKVLKWSKPHHHLFGHQRPPLPLRTASPASSRARSNNSNNSNNSTNNTNNTNNNNNGGVDRYRNSPAVITVVAVTDAWVRGVTEAGMKARAERERRSLVSFVGGPATSVATWSGIHDWINGEHGAYAAGKRVEKVTGEEKLMYAPRTGGGSAGQK